jgi:hypothetical protein
VSLPGADPGTDVVATEPPGTVRGATPAAAAVMRRALLVWGLGHLSIGDPRGWLLMVLQVLGILVIAALGIALLEGSRDVLVFVALVGYLVIWAGQAIDAQRRSVALGAASGGAIQILVLAPVAITALTLFWLVGGTAASPAAVLQRYVSAWRAEQPEVARRLFLVPLGVDELRGTWSGQSAYLKSRLAVLERSLGSGSGIKPGSPFESLMFVEAPASSAGRKVDAERADSTIAIDVVREVTVRGSFFGLFPTASQQTIPVERVGTVTLRAIPQDAVFGLARGQVWRIESVQLAGP